MPVTRSQYDLVEELRLPAGGAFIITDVRGRELFRVTDGDQPLLVEGAPVAGDSALPDPAEAPDGQAVVVVAGAYGLADVPLQVVTRSLTSAEILALKTTPVALVAGTPDVVLVPMFALLSYRAGATPYTTDGILNFGLPAGDFDPLAVVLTGFLDQPTDQVGFITGGGLNTVPTALIAGEDMVVYVDAAADPTDGDGTLDLTVFYREVDVS